MPILTLWQLNTLTGEPEQLGRLQVTDCGLQLDAAADSQRAWLSRIVERLNEDPPPDLPALQVRLAGRYNLLARPAR